MADIAVSDDMFAAALEDIVKDVSTASEKALRKGINSGAKTSAKEWRKGAPRNTGEYSKSIRFRTMGGQSGPSAVVYSTKPGLPHLLEKGHTTIGGGFVPPRVHIAPAAEEGFETAMKATLEALGEEGL